MHVRASYGLPAGLLRFFQPLWADLPGMRELSEALVRWGLPDLEMRLRMVAAAAGLAAQPGGGPAPGDRGEAARRDLYLSHQRWGLFGQ